jgi:hypothetical protein
MRTVVKKDTWKDEQMVEQTETKSAVSWETMKET